MEEILIELAEGDELEEVVYYYRPTHSKDNAPDDMDWIVAKRAYCDEYSEEILGSLNTETMAESCVFTLAE